MIPLLSKDAIPCSAKRLGKRVVSLRGTLYRRRRTCPIPADANDGDVGKLPPSCSEYFLSLPMIPPSSGQRYREYRRQLVVQSAEANGSSSANANSRKVRGFGRLL